MIEIHPPFRDLIPPLPADELQALEADIIAHGCIDPLIVWRGKLIDGHNRWGICTARGLAYQVRDLSESSLLPDEGSVMRWIIDHQLARRNLTQFQASYLRGKRYLVVVARADTAGQSGPRSQSGTYVRPDGGAGRARDEVAAQHGVGGRTVQRDADYARDVDAIAESAGLDARNAILRGEVRVTRKAIHLVAERRPESIEVLRAAVLELRGTKQPKQRTAEPSVAPYSTREIRELVLAGDGRTVVGAKLSCGHTVPFHPRKGSATRTKTMPCSRCGAGSRPAWERQRRRAVMEQRVRSAIADPQRLARIVDLVEGAIDVLTIAPRTQEQTEIWARVERAIYAARVLDAPPGAL